MQRMTGRILTIPALGIALSLLGVAWFARPARGQTDKSPAASPRRADEKPAASAKLEEAVRKQAEAVVKAFDRGDAKALSELWTPDGDYVSESGKHLKGREAIEAAFKKLFALNKGAKLRINITSVRMVTPDVVLEDGVTEVLPADGGPPSSARYHVVHAKKNGEWKMASVRETAYVPPSNYDHLQVVEWLIGDWVDDVKGAEVAHVSFDWTENKNFILGSITTTLKDVRVSGATQWIGWDPVKKQVRSWSFTSTGGFGQGTWSNNGKKWSIKTTAVQPDGAQLTATNVITRVDENHLTWQSTNRTLNGENIPDTPTIKMKRQE